MPKIDAPTVAEHRENMEKRLLDATEAILRDSHTARLTAGEVATRAGIARNSIYRYVDTVDELRAKVVARYLPDWLEAVDRAIGDATDPGDRIVAWVRANLEQAAETGHGWLMRVVRTMPSGATVDDVAGQAHGEMGTRLRSAWARVLGVDVAEPVVASAAGSASAASPDDPVSAGIRARLVVLDAYTQGIVESGFRLLDAGAPRDLVVEQGTATARALVASVRAGE